MRPQVKRNRVQQSEVQERTFLLTSQHSRRPLYILIVILVLRQCSGSLNKLNERHQFRSRGFQEGFFKLLLGKTGAEKGLHVKTIMPARDSPLARHVPPLRPTIAETDLMAEFGAAYLLVFVRDFGR